MAHTYDANRQEWAVVSGDGYAAYWIALEPGQSIISGRSIMEVDEDRDVSAAKALPNYPEWVAGQDVAEEDWYRHDSTLYEVVQAHHTQSDWTPDIVPALFRVIWEPSAGQTYPDWHQPTGAHDAYHVGDKVHYQDQDWECTAGDANGNNVWAPGVYGWVVI